MKTAEQFWSTVDVRGPDECWPWTGVVSPNGYGHVRWKGKTEGAHRVALQLRLGRPLELWALHSCDNRPCCNPAHLREGTVRDNAMDMVQRGRSAFGERAHFAVLTGPIVECIRECQAEGLSTREIARIANVNQSTIARALSRKTWRSPCITYGADAAPTAANVDAQDGDTVTELLKKTPESAG